MEKTPQRHPLDWPDQFDRTPSYERQTSYKFKMSFARAVERIVAELEMMGVDDEDIVISSNVPTRLDGLPRARAKSTADDCGVAVYWRDEDYEPLSLAIDTYDSVRGNLCALSHTLAALRSIERHGGADIMRRSLRGFKALPAAIPMGPPPWFEVLGVDRGASLETARDAFREAITKHHPDKGGDHAKAAELTVAWETAQKRLAS